MNKLKKKYSRYGVSEWITLAIGVLFGLTQYIRYALNLLGDNKVEIVMLVVWLLLIIAPLTLANLIRKARGLDPK